MGGRGHSDAVDSMLGAAAAVCSESRRGRPGERPSTSAEAVVAGEGAARRSAALIVPSQSSLCTTTIAVGQGQSVVAPTSRQYDTVGRQQLVRAARRVR
eukprot:SAG31_NODE_2784_length_5092_cov_10.113158_9_plen_98_part_01